MTTARPLLAETQYICECGWVLRQVPVPSEEGDEVRPAQWLYTCRNRGCEDYGKKFAALTRSARLFEVSHTENSAGPTCAPNRTMSSVNVQDGEK